MPGGAESLKGSLRMEDGGILLKISAPTDDLIHFGSVAPCILIRNDIFRIQIWLKVSDSTGRIHIPQHCLRFSALWIRNINEDQGFVLESYE
jgi:hypothetical protein